ncbi:MAG: hypothetical protein M3371_03875, partial [Acidobacteriota bacterium]|nr:hypothetical protein [Acidobacteriota bacterium]
RMIVKNPEARALAAKLEQRLWEHLATHWHAPTAQFAAPMSRCYRTDIGAPLWLQKSLGGAITFASLEDVRAAKIPAQGEVGMLEFRCPDDLKDKFVGPTGTTQHRELFALGSEKMRPVQGTTYLAPRFSLGSVNRGDFWVQRRPLLAYWGNRERPARYLQVRLMKDDNDFSSALFYSVQHKNCVLGAVNFCTPGGDKHLSLDPVKNGEFTAARLYLQFLIEEEKASLRLLADGEPLPIGDQSTHFPPPSRLTIQTSGCRISIAPRLTIFGNGTPSVKVVRSDAQTSIELHMLGAGGESQLIKWSDVRRAIAAFTVFVEETDSGSLESFDARSAKQKCEITQTEDQAMLAWESPAGRLQLSAGKKIVTAANQSELFAERINGSYVPVVRLSEARLDS